MRVFQLPFRMLVCVAFVGMSCACARPAGQLPDAPLPSPTPAPPIVLPRDAGPHDTLTEWWYYTGHLKSEAHIYGFEFVVFQTRRVDLPTGYLAHFAISDIDAGRFTHQAKFSQGDPASWFPLQVDGWTLDHTDSFDAIHAVMDSGYGLDLRLVDDKPPALHNGGYIEYGPAGGSYYYSRTRLSVTGTLVDDTGQTSAVSGVAWMDHQWGNFVVSPAGGWDWYSLQLDDNTELMLYVLRGSDGSVSGAYGTQVLADGTAQDVRGGSVEVAATGSWTSPHTGATYPSGWRLKLPDGAAVVLQPQLLDQELWFSGMADLGTVAYWEGAVTISGDRSGVGYVELTGYAR